MFSYIIKKSIILCIFLVFASTPISGFGDNQKASVSLLENSYVSDVEVRLGDIASIDSNEQSMKDKLQKMYICRSAEPGSSVTLNVSYIKSRIKQQGIAPESINWNGSDHLTVETKSVSISIQELQSSAETFITELAGKSAKMVKLQPANDIKPIMISNGKVNIRTELVSPYTVNNNVLLKFVYSVDGRDCGNRIIPFRVEVIKDIVVTTKSIDLHKVLNADDLTIVSQNVGLSSNIFYTKDELIGKRVKRVISKGTIISSDMVEQPPIIKQGDLITIVVESSSFRISAQGKAMENGIGGQVIRVINTLSMKEIQAKVVDGKTVKISL